MLWQKEKIADALYIDLLERVNYSLHNRRLHRKKNNNFSLVLRKEGNQKYLEHDYEAAWSKYNESVCFAEIDSEHLSLSYANRSQCFLKLQMYDRCLLDIQLAKDANYPERLLPKLENRKLECMNRLESSVQQKQTLIEPALSFEPDDKLPNMASVLQIQTDELYGRLVKAKCDINIGATLLIEEEYIHTVDSDVNNFCINCGKKKMNFIPCKNCADAMYCSMECKDNNFHEIECDMMLGSDDICDGQSLTFILRSVVIGINTFQTINEMMEVVENWRSTNPSEISESCGSSVSKYRTFFKLASFVTNQRILGFRKITYFIFHAIMGSSKIVYKFETTAAQRFLIHLIVHHGLILSTNSFSFEEDAAHIQVLSLLTSYFNHSCLPNVTKLTKGNLSICKTILPIKRGEQLFLTYINGEVFDMTEKQRNDDLEKIYGFRCQCKLCKHGRLQTGDLDNDPSFLYVSSHATDGNFDNAILSNIIQHSTEFLLRHPDMFGSKEVAYIADILAAVFSKQLNG